MFSRTEDLPEDCEPTTTYTESGQRREVPRPDLLATGPYNLWEVKRIAADRVEDQVLQLIHDAEEVLAQGRHGAVERVCKTRGLLQIRVAMEYGSCAPGVADGRGDRLAWGCAGSPRQLKTV